MIHERRIVLGRFRAGAAAADPPARVEDVMEPGPTTVRAHEPIAPLLESMARRQVDGVSVTTSEGELLGMVRRTKEEQ